MESYCSRFIKIFKYVQYVFVDFAGDFPNLNGKHFLLQLKEVSKHTT